MQIKLWCHSASVDLLCRHSDKRGSAFASSLPWNKKHVVDCTDLLPPFTETQYKMGFVSKYWRSKIKEMPMCLILSPFSFIIQHFGSPLDLKQLLVFELVAEKQVRRVFERCLIIGKECDRKQDVLNSLKPKQLWDCHQFCRYLSVLVSIGYIQNVTWSSQETTTVITAHPAGTMNVSNLQILSWQNDLNPRGSLHLIDTFFVYFGRVLETYFNNILQG